MTIHNSPRLTHITCAISAALLFSLVASNDVLACKKHHRRHHACQEVTYKEAPCTIAVAAPAPTCSIFYNGHWYVGANIGISRTNDSATTVGSVRQTGPGFSVDGGYQLNPIWGVEAGFTKYHNSEDNSHSINIATTEHYSVYLAGTAQYPIYHQLSALGKLGIAYNYAYKTSPAGPTADARSASAYMGLGASYKLTSTVDVIGQWARAVGNHLTGSTDLYSIGLAAALV